MWWLAVCVEKPFCMGFNDSGFIKWVLRCVKSDLRSSKNIDINILNAYIDSERMKICFNFEVYKHIPVGYKTLVRTCFQNWDLMECSDVKDLLLKILNVSKYGYGKNMKIDCDFRVWPINPLRFSVVGVYNSKIRCSIISKNSGGFEIVEEFKKTSSTSSEYTFSLKVNGNKNFVKNVINNIKNEYVHFNYFDLFDETHSIILPKMATMHSKDVFEPMNVPICGFKKKKYTVFYLVNILMIHNYGLLDNIITEYKKYRLNIKVERSNNGMCAKIIPDIKKE